LLPPAAGAETPAHLWSLAFTGGGQQAATAVAARGFNVWTAGHMVSTVDLGAPVYSSPLDEFLAMFDDDGELQWSAAFGDPGNCSITGMGVDVSNNVYVTGQFDGVVSFGGSALTSAGGQDIFLAKFNSSGAHQWSKRFGDASLNDTAFGLAVDATNTIIIGGRISGTTDFGGGALTSAGGMDAFIAKFNSAGTHQWSARFGDTADQQIDNVAVPSSGSDVYATGRFAGAINFGGGALNSAGQTDAFLAKFNSAGTHQWSQRYGGTSFDYGADVDATTSAVVLAVNFNGSINFGGSTLTSAGSQDIAVARFTTAGAHAWSQRYGDQDVQTVTAIDLGSEMQLVGSFEGTLDFGGHTMAANGFSSDMFLTKLRIGDGEELYSNQFGSLTTDWAFDVLYENGQTYLVGYFNNEVDFGFGDPLISPTRDSDACLAAFAFPPTEPAITRVKDLANDQGGVVTIEFLRAGYDGHAVPARIHRYDVYLREDPLPPFGVAPALDETWILAGNVPAHAHGSYVTLATTQADSTVIDGMHTSVFKVRGVTNDPAVYFDSAPMGGYSLDNLQPGIPLNLILEEGVLSWKSAGDSDVAYYSVYGSDGAFDETAVLVDYVKTTRLALETRSFNNYHVTATDHAGNEGRAASLSDAPRDTRPIPATLSVSAYPNPFNPATTIRYTLPAAGRVRVEIFDASGAHVRALVDDDAPPGAFTARWDGRNDAGTPAASGVYFARIQHAGASRACKMVMLK
jgi:hypothetical protein